MSLFVASVLFVYVCLCRVVFYVLFSLYHILFSFFFFQAEDGIRDLVRSRGLGDVYKRQTENLSLITGHCVAATMILKKQILNRGFAARLSIPVSYTHLTLPTSDLV